MRRNLLTIAIAASLAMLALAGCGPEPQAPLAGAAIGGHFALTDDRDRPFTDHDLLGQDRLQVARRNGLIAARTHGIHEARMHIPPPAWAVFVPPAAPADSRVRRQIFPIVGDRRQRCPIGG